MEEAEKDSDWAGALLKGVFGDEASQ